MPEPAAAAEVRTRIVVYLATIVALGAGAVLARSAEWITNTAVHALHETAAILLASLVGILSLVRYYSRRERLFLIIGTAFLGTAILDGYHGVVTFLAPAEDTAGLLVFSPWSWLASRAFLAVWLVRLSFARRERPLPPASGVSEGVTYASAALLVLAALGALTLAPLPAPSGLDGPVSQPQALVPAALFLTALVVSLAKGGWKHNVFEHWLVLALIMGFAGEALFMASSATLYDPLFDAGHLLRTASYACVLIGLLMSVFFTYRRLQESQLALASANVALQREIAEREVTQRELQIRTAYLEQLFESAPEAIVVVDENDRILRTNAEFTTIFGYTPSEAVGRTIAELIVQPEALREAAAVTRAVTNGLTVSYETVRRRKDGSLVDVSILGTPIRGAGGHVAVYGIYRDITDRKRAERESRESAERLQAVVDVAPLGIIIVDDADRVRLWNPAAERIVGVSARDALRRPLPLLNGEVADALQRARTGEQTAIELEWHRDDGPCTLSLTALPLGASANEHHGTLIVIDDITRRREAEHALRVAHSAAQTANRAKSRFLASMSDELRTPLNSVLGFTRVLLRNEGRNLRPMDVAYLERIAANSEYLLGVINNILDLSKIEAGRIELDMATTDLAPIIEHTLAEFEPRVGPGVQLRADVPEPLAPITTDPHRIRQVLANLIANALKFTPHGTVCVRVIADPVTRVPERIDVADTGIGIPEDRLAAIFEAFEHADGSTAHRFGGAGLGLSISRGLCNRLGYRLTVDSRVGAGSTFSIHLQPKEVAAAVS